MGCVGRCLGVCHFVGSWGMFGSRMFMLRVLDALRVFCCVGVDCLVVFELFACGKVLQGYGVFLLRRVWQEVVLRI